MAKKHLGNKKKQDGYENAEDIKKKEYGDDYSDDMGSEGGEAGDKNGKKKEDKYRSDEE